MPVSTRSTNRWSMPCCRFWVHAKSNSVVGRPPCCRAPLVSNGFESASAARSIAIRRCSVGGLPRDLAPGEDIEVSLRIVTPDAPGDYLLAIDLVQEGKAWFSDAGTPTLDIPFRVRP